MYQIYSINRYCAQITACMIIITKIQTTTQTAMVSRAVGLMQNVVAMQTLSHGMGHVCHNAAKVKIEMCKPVHAFAEIQTKC